jgi:hypothetical protein
MAHEIDSDIFLTLLILLCVQHVVHLLALLRGGSYYLSHTVKYQKANSAACPTLLILLPIQSC